MKKMLCPAVIGLILIGLAGAAFGQWPLTREMAQAQKSEPAGPNLTVTGRFQIFVSPNMKDHTFMVDSDTGRIWIFKKDHSSGDFSLKRLSVEEIDGDKQTKAGTGEKKTDDK